MLEVGIISPKNAKSILFKNLLDMFVVALCWWLWGFGLAGRGASGQTFEGDGSLGNFGLGEGLTSDGVLRWGSIDWKNSGSFIHSLTFATTTTTIMSGGVAERMKVEVYIFLSAILSSIIYATMVQWCWGDVSEMCGGVGG
jgi:Amt family ammonium transporter